MKFGTAVNQISGTLSTVASSARSTAAWRESERLRMAVSFHDRLSILCNIDC
jgi:hypothetical protein